MHRNPYLILHSSTTILSIKQNSHRHSHSHRCRWKCWAKIGEQVTSFLLSNRGFRDNDCRLISIHADSSPLGRGGGSSPILSTSFCAIIDFNNCTDRLMAIVSSRRTNSSSSLCVLVKSPASFRVQPRLDRSCEISVRPSFRRCRMLAMKGDSWPKGKEYCSIKRHPFDFNSARWLHCSSVLRAHSVFPRSLVGYTNFCWANYNYWLRIIVRRTEMLKDN